ncbi:BACON domain-containing protein [Alistipes sp.]|uniref:BACON domain-containing protein n=1 Tax=Alistipes sp. TaxID=1872444 RepID=UPI003AF1C9A1
MKIRSYIAVILCALAFAGCSNEDKKVTFSLDSEDIRIGAEGGIRNVRVASAENWIATTNEPWITISPANGRGTAECRILVDSALTDTPRRGVVRIQNQKTMDNKEITIDQEGFDYAISLDEKEVSVANYATLDERSFEVKIRTNVDFDVRIPDNAPWLKHDTYKVEFDRGIRPREVTVRFKWNINSVPMSRVADVVFEPKSAVELARQDNLQVTQEAAEPIDVGTRAGDSVSLLGIGRSLGMWNEWDSSERMDNWDNVILWEEGMEGYTPEKNGRVKYARFFLFSTKEGIPFEVQYLTAADELIFYSNTNSFQYSLDTGDAITKLPQLRRLTISGYGLTSLHEDFVDLKNLEYLELGSNNFQRIPEVITKENFPKLRVLHMGANQRSNIYDLSNTVKTNFGGLFEEEGFPRRVIEWDLDTLVLSVNYLQGSLPTMEDWEKYTAEDIQAADTLPAALIGIPKVMPHTKRFAINLNRLTGKLPDWLLYHPALDWWNPYTLTFNQEGKDVTGKSAGFDNEPVNMNYYYEFYKGFKNPNVEEGEDETPDDTK